MNDIRALLRKSAEEFEKAPIVETNYKGRDTFDRYYSRVSVELTHDGWSTFAYRYRGMGEPSWRQHASREEARAFARTWLGGKP